MERSNVQKRSDLEQKIPELESTLETVEVLQSKKVNESLLEISYLVHCLEIFSISKRKGLEWDDVLETIFWLMLSWLTTVEQLIRMLQKA